MSGINSSCEGAKTFDSFFSNRQMPQQLGVAQTRSGITGQDPWAGSLGGITGNFEGVKPLATLSAIDKNPIKLRLVWGDMGENGGTSHGLMTSHGHFIQVYKMKVYLTHFIHP